MSFWAGFAEGFSEARDRRERRELLMQELGNKRYDAALKAYQAKVAKTESRSQQEAALQMLKGRLQDAEGGEELLEALRKNGLAVDAAKFVTKFELDDKNKEVDLTGDNLVNAIRVYGGEDARIEPSLWLRNIMQTPEAFTDPEVAAKATAQIAGLTEGGKTGILDINPRAVYSGGNEGRKTAQEVYVNSLSAKLMAASAATNPDGSYRFPPNERINMEKAVNDLSSDTESVRQKAMLYWSNSPYGLEAYEEMQNSDIPAYGDIGDVLGATSATKTAADYSNRWDNLSEEERQQAVTQYPWLPAYKGAN